MLGIPALLALLAIPLLAGRTFEEGVSGYIITSWMILISGGLMTFVCLYAVGLVLRWTRTVSDEEYSNPNDYPVAFARKSIGMLLITMVLLWVTALSDNPAVVALVQLVLSAMSAWMLILALHPHRHRTVQEEQEQAPSPDAATDTDGHVTVYNRMLTESLALSILSAISEVVLEQKAYLDPHLTLQDVADRTGYNRTYVASLFKTELGGFFNYINTQRLAYVESYRRDHPEASLSEAIAEACFSSRTTYYSIKSRLKEEA
jgi:AraC-like DNA-binding protein